MDIMRIHNLFNLFAKGGVVAGDVTAPTQVVLLSRDSNSILTTQNILYEKVFQANVY